MLKSLKGRLAGALAALMLLAPSAGVAHAQTAYTALDVGPNGQTAPTVSIDAATAANPGCAFVTQTQPAAVTGATGTNANALSTCIAGLGGIASAATSTGGAGGNEARTGGIGGTSSGATAATGGPGGAETLTGGAGAAEAVATGTVVGGVGGAVSETGGAGGAVTGAATANTGGAGAPATVASGVGGAASGATTNVGGAAGPVNITAAAGGNGTQTGGAGGPVTITAGNAGTGGNAAGGPVNIVTGNKTGTGAQGQATINNGLALGGTAIVIPLLSYIPDNQNQVAAASYAVSHTVWVAPNTGETWQIAAVSATFGTTSTSGTLQCEVATGTQAIAAGTNNLSGAVSLSGTANTTVNGTLIGSPTTIAAGNRVNLIFAGTITGLANASITIALRKIT